MAEMAEQEMLAAQRWADAVVDKVRGLVALKLVRRTKCLEKS